MSKQRLIGIDTSSSGGKVGLGWLPVEEQSMPNDYDLKPPSTHAGDQRDRREQRYADANASLIDQVLKPPGPDGRVVDNLVWLISDGKITDKNAFLNQVLDAQALGQTKQLQDAVNKKLADNGSAYRIKIDDSMASAEDIGSIKVDLLDLGARKLSDTCSRSINNGPKIPEAPHVDLPQAQQLPPEWPRLDIVDPGRRKSPWS